MTHPSGQRTPPVSHLAAVSGGAWVLKFTSPSFDLAMVPTHRGSDAGQARQPEAARHAPSSTQQARGGLGAPVAPAPAGRIPREAGAAATSASEARQKQGGCGSARCGRADTPPWTPGGACLWRGQWLQSRTRRLVHLLQPRDERTDPPPREGVAGGQTAPREQRQGGAGHRRPGIRSWVGVPCRPWEPTGVSLMHSGAASEGSPHPRLCPGADCAAASPTRTGGRACCLAGLTCRSAASALLEDGTFGFVVYLMLLDST